jgi:ABC-type sugar transport system substrate-binding protein
MLDGLVKDMEEVAAAGIPVVEVEDEPIAAERHIFVPSGDEDGYEDDPM